MDYLPLHPKNVYKRPIKQVDKWLIEFYFPGGWIPFTSILAKAD